MAWNKRTADQVAAKHKSTKNRSLKRGIFTGVIVMALGVLSVLFLRDEKGTPPPQQTNKSARIREVKPAPTPTNVVKKTAQLTKLEKRQALLKKYRDLYGDNIPDNLKPTVYYLENPPTKKFHVGRSRTSIFKHQSEKDIAGLLLIEPGTWIYEQSVYDARFDADFANAVVDKIEILPSDSEEDKALKKAVIDTKAELVERVKNGEKASQIMTAEAKALFELGNYRRDLETELRNIRQDAKYTDQDVKDFVEAANKMLEAKGAQKIAMPNMLLRHVMLKRRLNEKKGDNQ